MKCLARPVAAAVLTLAALTGCTSGETDNDADGAVGTTATTPATVTSSTPVPGPDEVPVDLPMPAAERWLTLGGPDSELGLPASPATDVAGGSITDFQRGAIVVDATGRAFVVQGRILDAYLEAGGPQGDLGFPTSDEATTDGGWISVFEHGTIAFLDGDTVVDLD